ncbi:MAG: hypothetical protein IH626_07400 [Rhodospirillales bacterium]|nr:hypothetical protein [Rhodospirillales bacterium]
MERYNAAPDYLDRGGKYTLHDVLRVQEDAARLQAEVNAQVMGALVGGLGRAVRWLASGTTRVLRDHWAGLAVGRLTGELGRFSDSQLARLGIARGDIPSYVATLVDTPLMGDRPVLDSASPAIVGSDVADEVAANEEPARRRAA